MNLILNAKINQLQIKNLKNRMKLQRLFISYTKLSLLRQQCCRL